MAPAVSEDIATERILSYLAAQNRPYSAIDVFNNLHGEIKKPQVLKSLEQLAKNDQIVEKVYGKQKVYCAKQDGEDVSEEEMKVLEKRAAELTDELKQLQDLCRPLEQKNKEVSNMRSTEELVEILAALRAKNAQQAAALSQLKSGTKVVSKEEVVATEKKLQEAKKAWRQRKRMCNEIVDMVMESYPKKKKDLLDVVGIETDEAVGLDPNAFGL